MSLLLLALTLAVCDAAKLSFSHLDGSDGLCSPRKLRVKNGELLVAESGEGLSPVPANPEDSPDCFVDAGNITVCIGMTSQLTKIASGTKTVVQDGFISIRPLEGRSETHATGVNDVLFGDDSTPYMYYILTGLGQEGLELHNFTNLAFGAIVGILDENGTLISEIVSEPWKEEYTNNPDGENVDSNPYHFLSLNGNFYVADAGANTILTYSIPDPSMSRSVAVIPKVSGLAALPQGVGPCINVTPPMGPAFCGQTELNGAWYYDVQSVPTSVRMRPGTTDKIYVSTLSGAIWSEPAALIYEVPLDQFNYPIEGSESKIAGPFWAIADFEFVDENTLYVLETAAGGFTIPFKGRLTKVDLMDGTTEVLAEEDLFLPTGIAIEGDKIYITNNTFSEELCGGHVIYATLPSTESSWNRGDAS